MCLRRYLLVMLLLLSLSSIHDRGAAVLKAVIELSSAGRDCNREQHSPDLTALHTLIGERDDGTQVFV